MMTSQREYHGYIIKLEPQTVGYGKQYAIYKDDNLIGYCDREKVAEETVDWHITYQQGGIREC